MWKDWLALSKREQKGLMVLSGILFMLIIYYLVTPLIFHPANSSTDKDLQQWIDSLNKINQQHITPPAEDSVFFFDPNTASITYLEAIGIKGEALINLLKFRESGARFKKPEDILNIYYLDSALAHDLLKHIKIDSSMPEKGISYQKTNAGSQTTKEKNRYQTQKRPKTKEKIKDPSFVIEINSADTAEFALLNGIGPVLSKRIVAFRKALGGFYSPEQLKEVYGISAETIERNISHLQVDTLLLKKIDINKASLRKLKAHPYIGFYLAKDIVEYRKKNYPVRSIKEIFSLKYFTPKERERLSEYLTVK